MVELTELADMVTALRTGRAMGAKAEAEATKARRRATNFIFVWG